MFRLSCYFTNFIGLRVFADCDNNKCHKDATDCKSDCSEHRHQKGHLCELMALAHSAHEKLLKEKMKANMEVKIGKKLDKVADLVVDAMIEKYKKNEEFENKLNESLKKKAVE